ncbi:hypothetical protein F2Q69_00007147 [Brassica cretica]|uniref:Uncharacterized protein n=1 Tax=Brassica cretica TaxID=69181 RepID=A0A8S9PF65_BRACR|nr:hypothetical protein F2Q69_00007147 [Brassica cretica]
MTHEEFAEKHPHPPSHFYIKIDRPHEPTVDRQRETDIDRPPSPPIDRRAPLTYRVRLPSIDSNRINALRQPPKPLANLPEPTTNPSDTTPEPMQVDEATEGRVLRKRKEKIPKHLKREANEKEMNGFTKRVLRIPVEKHFDEVYYTHRLWMCIPSSTRRNKEKHLLFSEDPVHLERTIRKDQRSTSIDAAAFTSTDSRTHPSTDTQPSSSTDLHRSTSIDSTPRTSINPQSRNMVVVVILRQDENGDLCMPNSTRSNKEKHLLFSEDLAHLERTIRKDQRSTSIDAEAFTSTDSRTHPSTDTRPSSSTDIHRSTSTDSTPRTSIDPQSRSMVAIVILRHDENGNLYDQDGHLRNATDQDEDRSTDYSRNRSTSSAESTAECSEVRIMTHEEFAEKDPHPPSPFYVKIDRPHEPAIDRQRETDIDRYPSPPIDRRAPLTYRV